MRTIISGGKVVTPDDLLPGHTLVLDGPRIAAVEAGDRPPGPDERAIDARGCWVVPGFIDLHVHGSDGHDVMDATVDAIHGMARFFARHGVTTYLPTTMTASRAATLAAIENVARCPQPADGAHHIGVHVEGPYVNPEYRGAQLLDHIRLPDPTEYAAWWPAGVVRLITLAPELAGANELIEQARSHGAVVTAGHSAATYEQVEAAVERGLDQATHTFNAMPALHHREPGLLGAALTDDRIYAQLITDGIHVHPAVTKLLVRAKGAARTILITDAMRATGLLDGTYDLGGQAITVKEGVARTATGNLAGSTLTYDAGLRNIVRFTGLPLVAALPMATSAPAAALGLAGKKGVLRAGADADVTILDTNLHVQATIVAGEIVYQSQEFGQRNAQDASRATG